MTFASVSRGSPPAEASPTITSPPAGRLVSLDALRGFDMFWILGADLLVQALGRISHSPVAQFFAGQLDHKPWAGYGFYDLIFPLFVFIVGVSLVFSLTKQLTTRSRGSAMRHVLGRTVILFGLGIIYNGGLTEPWPDVRLAGVLQRIAICYAAAAILFCYVRPRTLAAIIVALLVGYWALLTFVPIRDLPLEREALAARLGPSAMANGKSVMLQEDRVTVPNPAEVRRLFDGTTAPVRGRYESGFNVANQFDYQYLPGRMYNVYWDPEGYLSTFPAIATCLLGVLAGLLLRRTDLDGTSKVRWLLAAGVGLLAVGLLWNLQFPIIKKIWTSTFVLVAGGWSFVSLGAFYYLVDIRQWRGWCAPFIWIGMNPITLYMLSALVDFQVVARHLAGGDVARFFDRILAPGGGDLVIALVALVLVVLVAWFLHRRRIFLKV
jgi:predicted acyltransferase